MSWVTFLCSAKNESQCIERASMRSFSRLGVSNIRTQPVSWTIHLSSRRSLWWFKLKLFKQQNLTTASSRPSTQAWRLCLINSCSVCILVKNYKKMIPSDESWNTWRFWGTVWHWHLWDFDAYFVLVMYLIVHKIVCLLPLHDRECPGNVCRLVR